MSTGRRGCTADQETVISILDVLQNMGLYLNKTQLERVERVISKKLSELYKKPQEVHFEYVAGSVEEFPTFRNRDLPHIVDTLRELFFIEEYTTCEREDVMEDEDEEAESAEDDEDGDEDEDEDEDNPKE